jgi:predicted Fe-S protein YdhL (DUF1289 family)
MASIQTPCVNVCAMSETTGLCTGCGRTLTEIAAWPTLTDAQREAIMAALPARMEAARCTTPVAH